MENQLNIRFQFALLFLVCHLCKLVKNINAVIDQGCWFTNETAASAELPPTTGLVNLDSSNISTRRRIVQRCRISATQGGK